MGLLSSVFKKSASPEPPKPVRLPQNHADVATKPASIKKEVKPVADKITLGYTHLMGVPDGLWLRRQLCRIINSPRQICRPEILPTLADARHVQKVDVSFIEGSVCINDKLAVEELKETREKSAVVVALGGCACYGNITRFSRGGRRTSRPMKHTCRSVMSSRLTCYIPGCAPTPQMIRNVAVMAYLLLKGTKEQKDLATAFLKPLMMAANEGTSACFCDLMTKVINQGLCMGCGGCDEPARLMQLPTIRQAPGRARPVH